MDHLVQGVQWSTRSIGYDLYLYFILISGISFSRCCKHSASSAYWALFLKFFQAEHTETWKCLQNHDSWWVNQLWILWWVNSKLCTCSVFMHITLIVNMLKLKMLKLMLCSESSFCGHSLGMCHGLTQFWIKYWDGHASLSTLTIRLQSFILCHKDDFFPICTITYNHLQGDF